MKKFFLVLFVILDLAVMAVAALVLYVYVSKRAAANNGKQTSTPGPLSLPSLTLRKTPPRGSIISPSTPPVLGGTAPAGGTMAIEPGTRKILFTYRNVKAKQVSIRADFTGWKADAMRRNPGGVWTFQATLSPGEYAYCYTADDKTFKDPANKRTKQIGRTFVSAIVVEPLPAAKPPK